MVEGRVNVPEAGVRRQQQWLDLAASTVGRRDSDDHDNFCACDHADGGGPVAFLNGLPLSLSDEVRSEFGRRVARVVTRGLAQLEQPPLKDAELENLAALLLELGGEGGWKARFGGGHDEMTADQVAMSVRRVTALFPHRGAEIAGLAKQLLKTCFQPAPAECRESYRECDTGGRCRRQERSYDLARISGAHCVDCPYWEERDQEEHVVWLGAQWKAGFEDLDAHRAVYLPEDFRALRCWAPWGDRA